MSINRYNELEYAKILLESGFQSKYKQYELKILAKYFKYLGQKPAERKENIYLFCEKYINDFSREEYYSVINRVVKYSTVKKNVLIIINDVSVYKPELDYIGSLKTSKDNQKIIFTLLVNRKLRLEINKQISNPDADCMYFGGSRSKFTNLKNVAKLQSSTNINKAINELHNLGAVVSTMNGLIRLNFIESLPTSKSDEGTVLVNSFDNIGLFYDRYLGDKKIIECSSCSKLVRQKSNRTKYCDECLKEKERENTKNRVKKYRNKVNVTV